MQFLSTMRHSFHQSSFFGSQSRYCSPLGYHRLLGEKSSISHQQLAIESIFKQCFGVTSSMRSCCSECQGRSLPRYLSRKWWIQLRQTVFGIDQTFQLRFRSTSGSLFAPCERCMDFIQFLCSKKCEYLSDIRRVIYWSLALVVGHIGSFIEVQGLLTLGD